MRRKGRVDGNHSAIVDALRNCGCSVQSLASIGSGVPDLLIARCGRIALAEVKDGSKSPSHRKLTPDEQEWIARWKSEVTILTTVDEAIKLANSLT